MWFEVLRPGYGSGVPTDDHERHEMSSKSEEVKGRAKEAVGAVTDDDSLRREGKTDQASASVKEKLEDAVDSVKDKVERIVGRD
jgi:uncharacterized protein YjbJ (UPF0337 family)